MRATEYLDMIKNGFDADRELRMSHLNTKDLHTRETIKLKRREIKKMARVDDLFEQLTQ